MIRRLACFFSAFVILFVSGNFELEAAASEKTDTKESSELQNPNLLGNYTSADWVGDTLYLDESSTSVYFMPKDDKEQSAVLTFERNGCETGFYFRIDAGNGGNSGGDSGFCTLSFYDEDHNQLLSLSTGQIQGFDNYSRFYIGEEANYFPIPERTKTAEISLNAVQNGNSGRVNVYFRNLSLHFSGEKPLLPNEKKLYFDSTAGLTKVEIGVTKTARYIWIAVIFLVALAFYIIRMWQQKYSTAKVMKAADRKNGK